MPTPPPYLERIGGVAAIAGVVVLFMGTLLHPMHAAPDDLPSAFAEYAGDRFWVATHLAQLLGVLSIGAGLLALSWKLRTGRAGAWALLAGFTTIAGVSLAGALQAVDGIALKFAVDRWSAASEAARATAFEAAYAIRQVEVGLASVMGAFFGLAAVLYGTALMLTPLAPKWLGVFGVLSGAAAAIASILQAHTGFSHLAMTTMMFSSSSLLVWSVCAGIFLWRWPRTDVDADGDKQQSGEYRHPER